MPRTPLAIAIDIGGTSAKLALVTSRGRLLFSRQIPTGRRMGVRQLMAQMIPIVQTLHRQARQMGGDLRGIGVGVPGLVDVEQGTVRYLVNLPGWRQVPLRQMITRATRLPTIVDNDVKMMTWGEYRWGAGRGVQSLMCVMLGTGVGGGLVIHGRLYRGWTMSAGEIGHMPMGETGPRCPCGGRACLERYIGNRAVVALARQRARAARRSLLWSLTDGDLRRLTPPLIDRAAYRGDAAARAVWHEVGERLGVALTTVANVLNPERIVIGGGLAKAGPLLFPTVRSTVRARAMRGPHAVQIVPARWGEQAGVIGAAAMVLVPEPH